VLTRTLWSVRVSGAERVPAEGPVLLAANHQGFLDGPLLLGTAPRPAHILVKEEMFVGPVGWVLRAGGQIPVDRSGGRAALAAGLAVLRRGGVVGIFPEGNRGRGDVSGARAGIAWLALHGQAPVVPVALLGTRRTGESVGGLPGLGRRLAVEFGDPVTVSRGGAGNGRAALAAAAEAIRSALADLVAGASARTGIPLPTDAPTRPT